MKMNKLLIALGLAAAVVLVLFKKKHLKQVQRQVNTLKMLLNKHADINKLQVKLYHTKKLQMKHLVKIGAAADEAAAKTEAAAEDVKNASKEATAHVAGAVEQGAADVKEKAQ
jgi:biopolymer transport protein ExbB/TolQ